MATAFIKIGFAGPVLSRQYFNETVTAVGTAVQRLVQSRENRCIGHHRINGNIKNVALVDWGHAPGLSTVNGFLDRTVDAGVDCVESKG